jgi:hypothetical protein
MGKKRRGSARAATPAYATPSNPYRPAPVGNSGGTNVTPTVPPAPAPAPANITVIPIQKLAQGSGTAVPGKAGPAAPPISAGPYGAASTSAPMIQHVPAGPGTSAPGDASTTEPAGSVTYLAPAQD